jgi:transposase-like protein
VKHRGGKGDGPQGQQVRYGAEFKRATLQELLAGGKTVAQICRERRIDETTLRRWRLEYEEQGAAACAMPAPGTPTAEEKIAELARGIGQLAVENMVLKKALQRARSLSAPGTPSSVSGAGPCRCARAAGS